MKVTTNFARLNRDLENAVKKAVAIGVASLGRDLVQSISKPGTGRVYAKQSRTGVTYTRIRNRRGESIREQYAAVRRSRSAKSALKKLGLRGSSFSRRDIASAIRQVRAAGGRLTRSQRSAFWKASAPGQPPAVRTGLLRRSWQTSFQAATPAKQGNRYVATVGSSVKYAAWLEFGTKTMQARPYVRPAAARLRGRFQAIVNEQVSAVMQKYGGKR